MIESTNQYRVSDLKVREEREGIVIFFECQRSKRANQPITSISIICTKQKSGSERTDLAVSLLAIITTKETC
jgi:hypothetical protein